MSGNTRYFGRGLAREVGAPKHVSSPGTGMECPGRLNLHTGHVGLRWVSGAARTHLDGLNEGTPSPRSPKGGHRATSVPGLLTMDRRASPRRFAFYGWRVTRGHTP